VLISFFALLDAPDARCANSAMCLPLTKLESSVMTSRDDTNCSWSAIRSEPRRRTHAT